MIRHSRSSLLALLLVTEVAFGGCSAHQRLATQAVSFNLALEKSQNEMLLLNVIRAQDRLPMYLTGMSTLTGNVQTTFGATAGGSYTRAKGSTTGMMASATDTLTHAYTPSAMASEMENPSYTMTVLDTQEFMRGFMSPLGKDLFAYYWNQGWPPAVLLYLLVERVEIKPTAVSPVQALDNYPDDSDSDLKKLNAFGTWIETKFLAGDPKIEGSSTPEKIGPPLPATKLQDLEELVKAAKEKLVLAPCKDPAFYRLQSAGTPNFAFRFNKPEELKKPNPDKPGINPNTPEIKPEKPPKANADPCKDDDTAVSASASENRLAEKQERIGVESDSTITFVLRSPEALLYYLGELMRVANRKDDPKVLEVCIQKRFQPLFVAYPGGTCPNPFLSAESAQGLYSIPAPDKPLDECKDGNFRLLLTEDKLKRKSPVCEAGRSLQAFRLLNQLMSLQKSAKDLSAPALVRVIGQ